MHCGGRRVQSRGRRVYTVWGFGGQQQAEEQWDPISAAALFQAAVLQKNRAGGPDGWAGLPFAMSDLTEIFQTWESIGCLRTVWNHITQVMIPKAGGLRADGTLLSASCAPSAFSVVGGEFIVELGCQEPRNSCGWNVTLWVIKPVAGKTGLVRPRSCNWQSVLPRKSSLLRLIMLRLLITLVRT